MLRTIDSEVICGLQGSMDRDILTIGFGLDTTTDFRIVIREMVRALQLVFRGIHSCDGGVTHGLVCEAPGYVA